MRVSVVQPDLIWENKQANLGRMDDLIHPLLNETDLIVLPEMFSTGFTMNTTGESEEMNGLTFAWMKEKAVEGNFGICGSFIVREEGKFFNRFVFVSPEKGFYYYDKRHLFSMGEEDKFYSQGRSKLVINFRGVRISPYICYDLRFPIWSRNRNDYDLCIYVASWPAVRINVWNTLLRARAIENQCYVAGSNRIGSDGMGLDYNGMSQIISPKGEIMKSAGIYEEGTITAEISLDDLVEFRNKFDVLRDADDFDIKL
jgi:predicted amidohydrolase